MRMRLVYLACTLLWLVMSALIGISFVSRSVFNAEQSFNVFSAHTYEQAGQRLQANEIVLGSFAAFCAQTRSDAGERAFADRMQQGNRQIAGLFRLDGPEVPESLFSALQASGALIPEQKTEFVAVLLTLRQQALRNHGLALSRPLRNIQGRADYLLARSIEPRGRAVVAMLVHGQALVPPLSALGPGGALQLVFPHTAASGSGVSIQAAGKFSGFETWLFPRLSSRHEVGSAAQPMVLQLFRQLGYADIDKMACLIALILSLSLLLIILFGVSSYARFLEGRQEREMRLFYMANHDRLTNLANRNLFFDRLHHAISRLNRNGRKLAVLFLDMDRFKPVNDTFGHATGDRVLQLIATRLKLELRVEDTVARLGGDEFVVLLEDVESKDEVNMVVDRLKRAIESPYEVGENRIRLGVSIGVAYYPDDGVLIEELLQVADRKMYGDKNDLTLTV
jgi:diguanylate cyclase (GGDEF)-like protein